MFWLFEKIFDFFVVGIVTGVLLAALYTHIEESSLQMVPQCIENTSEIGKRTPLSITPIYQVLQNHISNIAVQPDLVSSAQNIRIGCLIHTSRMFHKSRAKLVKDTWGSRCNVLLFESDQRDDSLPALTFSSSSSEKYNWGRTKKALQHMHRYHYNKFDWLIRTDHNAYVVVENLRLLLSQYNTEEPIQLGYRLRDYTPQGHISGGGGHVLSKEAITRVVEKGLNDQKLCSRQDEGILEKEFGECLYNLGVKIMDTRDSQQRWRFFYFDPLKHLPGAPPIQDSKFWNTSWYRYKEGDGCCSSSPIAWRDVRNENIGVLEYLLYSLRPIGHPNPLDNIEAKDILYKV